MDLRALEWQLFHPLLLQRPFMLLTVTNLVRHCVPAGPSQSNPPSLILNNSELPPRIVSFSSERRVSNVANPSLKWQQDQVEERHMAFAQQQYVELMHPTYSHREKAALEAAKRLKKKKSSSTFPQWSKTWAICGWTMCCYSWSLFN